MQELVHLVGQHEKLVPVGQLDQPSPPLFGKHRAGRIVVGGYRVYQPRTDQARLQHLLQRINVQAVLVGGDAPDVETVRSEYALDDEVGRLLDQDGVAVPREQRAREVKALRRAGYQE